MTSSVPEPLPGQPRDADGPLFRHAWEAQAFAMALTLHRRGVFTWKEWAGALSDAIRDAKAEGDPDLGDTYYHHWLNALEKLVVEKGVVSSVSLHETAHAWMAAARATPHGKPIILGPFARN